MPQQRDTILNVRENTTLMPFLLLKMGGMSRTSIKQLLARRIVQVAGKVVTHPDTPLMAGQEVRIVSSRGKQALVHPKLKVVYEDDYLIVVEKKQGLLTVAAHPGAAETTVLSILMDYVKKENRRNGVYVVHRLDRETSGLLVFAKTPQLQEYMRTYWKQLVTQRTYVALAEGLVQKDEDTIRTWFTEDPRTTMVYSSPVDDGGKLAVTHYRVVRRSTEHPALSLLELHLDTGRTNQIRVHMAGIGHPIVGDRKYGSGHQPVIDRLALHARILEFIHPVTEETVHFETAVPREFLHVFH